MSVNDCGGNLPYPMHSMCDIALNRAHEYCSNQNASCNKSYDRKSSKMQCPFKYLQWLQWIEKHDMSVI